MFILGVFFSLTILFGGGLGGGKGFLEGFTPYFGLLIKNQQTANIALLVAFS